MRPLRDPLLTLSRSASVKRIVATLPLSAVLVRGQVAGERVEDALTVVRELRREGLAVTIDHLGEETVAESQAVAAVAAYRTLIDRLSDAGLAAGADVSVKPTALGLRLTGGEWLAQENARKICRTAARAGVTVTVDTEDHATTDATLRIVTALREEFPETGVVLRAHLRRTEDDCRALAHAGSRVRLGKGAYGDPEDVAFTDPGDIDRSYVRCLKLLLAGDGYPMIATHDPRLIEIAGALASRYGRAPTTYELQLRYGVRPAEQRRLVASGEQVRVHLPYGSEWYGYLAAGVAERPANLRLFLTSLVSRR